MNGRTLGLAPRSLLTRQPVTRARVVAGALRRLLLAMLVLMFAAGCADNVRNEAQLLVDRLERIEEDAPLAVRQRELASVRRLGLSAEEVVRVRDACVRAHDALLTAEREQESARAALERATGAGAELPPADATRIAAAIERSDRAIAQSRELFPACQEGKRGLMLRFGGREHAP